MLSSTRNHRIVVSLILFLASLFVFLEILWTTRNGIGLEVDSCTYIGVAQNLLDGNGLTTYNGAPLNHYPPLYPLLLAGAGMIHNDPLSAARWLHAGLFAINVLIIGLVLYRATQRSVAAMSSGILVALSSWPLVVIHSEAISEPSFIIFALGGMWSLAEYIRRSKLGLLLVSALSIGLAILTRYAGIALVPAGFLSILLLQKKAFVKRLVSSLTFSFLSIVGLGIWIIRNLAATASATNRSLAFHPISVSHVRSAVSTLSEWILPHTFPIWIRLFCLAAFFLVTMVAYVKILQKSLPAVSKTALKVSTYLQAIFIIFVLSYGMFLIASISFADAHTPLDNRILSPLYAVGLIFFVCLCWDFLTIHQMKRYLGYITFIFLLFSVFQFTIRLPLTYALHTQGLGYASISWKHSEVVGFIRSLPEDICIYSNAPDAIYILLNRKTKMLPAKFSAATNLVNPRFEEELEEMRVELTDKGGLIIWFDQISWRWYLPSIKELYDLISMSIVYQGADGTVYRIEGTRCNQPETALNRKNTSTLFHKVYGSLLSFRLRLGIALFQNNSHKFEFGPLLDGSTHALAAEPALLRT